jgi:quercetin dioxygenase-like cupin family protein
MRNNTGKVAEMASDVNPIHDRKTMHLLESPDGGMRDTVSVSDACGATDLCAGLVWIAPGATIHEDSHPFDEVYYVIRGTGELILDGAPHVMTEGDIVHIPSPITHRVHNPSDHVFEIFWCIGGSMAQLPGVADELAKWPTVNAAEGWHLA